MDRTGLWICPVFESASPNDAKANRPFVRPIADIGFLGVASAQFISLEFNQRCLLRALADNGAENARYQGLFSGHHSCGVDCRPGAGARSPTGGDYYAPGPTTVVHPTAGQLKLNEQGDYYVGDKMILNKRRAEALKKCTHNIAPCRQCGRIVLSRCLGRVMPSTAAALNARGYLVVHKRPILSNCQTGCNSAWTDAASSVGDRV